MLKFKKYKLLTIIILILSYTPICFAYNYDYHNPNVTMKSILDSKRTGNYSDAVKYEMGLLHQLEGEMPVDYDDYIKFIKIALHDCVIGNDINIYDFYQTLAKYEPKNPVWPLGCALTRAQARLYATSIDQFKLASELFTKNLKYKNLARNYAMGDWERLNLSNMKEESETVHYKDLGTTRTPYFNKVLVEHHYQRLQPQTYEIPAPPFQPTDYNPIRNTK